MRAMLYHIWIRNYTDEYYQALGRFVAEFTEIEGGLQVALWNFAKVKSPIAQAVFSGVRADDAANKITRIADAENWSQKKRDNWQAITTRLGILRTLRNDILHYGAEWQIEGDWIVTNRGFVHKPEKIVNTPISVQILSDATADLEKLSLHIFHFIFADEGTPLGMATIRAAIEQPWRYTPPSPAPPPNKSSNKSSKSRRQRRPSGG
jgi:hypothetical protein